MKYFLLLLLLITGVYHLSQNVSDPTSRYEKQSNIKIIDGDTFVLKGEHIRLLGINAPEIDHGDKKADCGGYSSTSQLEYYLTAIRPYSMLRIDRKGTDKYGRTLATVYIDTDPISINQHLVKDGFAKPFRPEGGTPAPNYDSDYLSAINNLAGNLGHCTYQYQ